MPLNQACIKSKNKQAAIHIDLWIPNSRSENPNFICLNEELKLGQSIAYASIWKYNQKIKYKPSSKIHGLDSAEADADKTRQEKLGDH